MEYSNESVEVTEERRAARSVLIWVVVMVGLWALFALVLPAAAHAGTPYIETTRHGVVVSSTFPHCSTEDPSVVEIPCTWNVGPGVDGNGRGFAFILKQRTDHSVVVDYVWNYDPQRMGWRWEGLIHTPHGLRMSDCLIKAGVNHERCPDGNHPLDK